jgi:hypothetical protein
MVSKVPRRPRSQPTPRRGERRNCWPWLAVMLLLLLARCGRGPQDLPDVAVELGIEPDPPRLGQATVTVDLRDAGGQPISGARVEIEGNMNHAGMVPVFATASTLPWAGIGSSWCGPTCLMAAR